MKCKKGASAQSLQRAHEQRSDCSSGVLGHACRSDELQWNGSCRACRSADLSPHSLRIWRDRLEQFGNEIGEACFIRVHWSIKQRCSLPLAGPVRSESLESAATRGGDPRRRRREPGACAQHVAGSSAAARRDDGYHDVDRAASVMEPRYHHAPQYSVGRLQRATARNLAIQLQRPTWHLCWTSVAARSREDTALSASVSPPSLVRIGPFRIVHEQYRELGTSGSSDEQSWSRSQ